MSPVGCCRARASTSLANIDATDVVEPMAGVHNRKPSRTHDYARLLRLKRNKLATHTARRPSAAFGSSFGGGTSLGGRFRERA